MEFASSWTREPAGLVLEAILASMAGIALLIGFIVLRRWYRGRYFQRRNQRAFALRARWDDIVSGQVPAATWRFKPLDCEVVESILLDNIEMAQPDELPKLLACLRRSGLLDTRIFETRSRKGTSQRVALIALGRTRAPEAIPALAEGLEAEAAETRVAAVRGLGRTGLLDAAVPILDLLVTNRLNAPEQAIKNALLNCCRGNPHLLLRYMPQSSGAARELLARVLGELATPDLGDELLVLATDRLPEVRASAARALGNAQPSFALSVLAVLAADPEWFVRLRAVVALSNLAHPETVRPLLLALCDPNRHVRQRAAWALARREPELERIFDQVVGTRDRYALEAFVSELERSGGFEKVVRAIQDRSPAESAAAIILKGLAASRQRETTTAAVAGSR
jgi:HEAT repeat protein